MRECHASSAAGLETGSRQLRLDTPMLRFDWAIQVSPWQRHVSPARVDGWGNIHHVSRNRCSVTAGACQTMVRPSAVGSARGLTILPDQFAHVVVVALSTLLERSGKLIFGNTIGFVRGEYAHSADDGQAHSFCAGPALLCLAPYQPWWVEPSAYLRSLRGCSSVYKRLSFGFLSFQSFCRSSASV